MPIQFQKHLIKFPNESFKRFFNILKRNRRDIVDERSNFWRLTDKKEMIREKKRRKCMAYNSVTKLIKKIDPKTIKQCIIRNVQNKTEQIRNTYKKIRVRPIVDIQTIPKTYLSKQPITA